LLGLKRLGGGVDVMVADLACCIVRFMPRGAFVVGGFFGDFFRGFCSGFGMPLDCLSVFSGVEGMRVVEA
jgi:hypothetical protein